MSINTKDRGSIHVHRVTNKPWDQHKVKRGLTSNIIIAFRIRIEFKCLGMLEGLERNGHENRLVIRRKILFPVLNLRFKIIKLRKETSHMFDRG